LNVYQKLTTNPILLFVALSHRNDWLSVKGAQNKMNGKLKLKKYANRRLYDTEKSTYVTLSEVAEIIRQGRAVEIFDAKTEEDVTHLVLTQIIMEESKNKNALLPVSLLHLAIQYGDNLLIDFFENHLRQTLELYLKFKLNFDDQFKKWLAMGMRFPHLPSQDLMSANPLSAFFDSFFSSKKPGKEK
jgi:polyhydroxyalkanoate synthesis repressor PhaR